MSHEIELITDGDGLAVIGAPADVERFLVSEGLTARDLGLPRLQTTLRAGSIAAETGAAIAASSGRWLKLTDTSVELMKKHNVMKGSEDNFFRAVLSGDNGKFTNLLEFTKAPASHLTNPAVLSGVGGIMSQMAMQRSMDEINAYLATIDEKVDDILRAHKDAVLADMIGVDFVIDEAMTVRDQVGRVSEVTWSKVQATSLTIGRTQAYALRQLDALAEKLVRKSSMDALAKTTVEARATAQGWLAVLARCFQLQDALAILELDRVLDDSPEELDNHRLGLKTARSNRLELIASTTGTLLQRMDAAAKTANRGVLLHPIDAKSAVRAIDYVADKVVGLRETLGIESDRESIAAKRWVEAFVDKRDEVVQAGAEGVEVASRLGAAAFVAARSTTDKIAIKASEGARRRAGDTSSRAETAEAPKN